MVLTEPNWILNACQIATLFLLILKCVFMLAAIFIGGQIIYFGLTEVRNSADYPFDREL